MAGDLNVTWIHGAHDCAASTDPPIQVHRYDPDTFILRQNKCSEPGTDAHPGPSREGPFMYLLFGKSRALLLDSGASRSATVFPLAATVERLIHDRSTALGQPPVSLVVAHSHSHGDHAAGDAQLRALPRTTVVPLGVTRVSLFFGLSEWPEGRATFDLGERALDVLPIPGHEDSHIAVFDRTTGLLLTGDTLYPGLLVVNDWPAYVQSVARLRAFVDDHDISWVLGGHVEMTSQPGRWFGLLTQFQPDEHRLQLTTQHVVELHEAVQSVQANPRTVRRADFIVQPANRPLPSLQP